MNLFRRRELPPPAPVPAPVNFHARAAAEPRELPARWRPEWMNREEREYAGAMPGIQVGQPISIPSQMADLKDAYDLIPAAFAGVRIVSNSAAKIPIVVYQRRKGSDEAISEHPLSEMLHPTYGKLNPWTTAFEGWEQVFAEQQLVGSAYWLKDLMEKGKPRELSRLDPLMMKPVESKRGNPISHYEYGPDRTRYRYEDIVPFKFFNPASPLIGHSPLMPGRKHMVLQLYMLGLNTAFFRNGATLGGIIMFKQMMKGDGVRSMMERFNEDHRGSENAYKWRGVAGAEEAKELGLNNKELEFKDGLNYMDLQILRALGVDPVLVGSVEGATYENKREAMKGLYDGPVGAILARRDAAVNLHLAPLWGEGLYVQSDFSNVEALLPNMEQVSVSASTAWKDGALTKGEYRQWLKTRQIPSLDARPDDEEIYSPPSPIAQPGTGEGDAGPPSGDNLPRAASQKSRTPKDDVEDFIARSAMEYDTWKAETRETAKKKATVIEKRVDKAKPVMEKKALKIFRAQEELLLGNLTRLSPTDLSAINDLLMSIRGGTREEYASGLRKLIENFGPLTMKDISPDEVFDATSESVLRHIANTSAKKIVILDDTTGNVVREEVRKALVAAQVAGENITDTATRIMEAGIRSGFEIRRGRAATIAQTETNAAYSFADLESYRQSDVVETKVWNAILDDHTRDTHREANGQEVLVSDPFTVGGYHLMHPGDPDGPAEEVIECRCFMTPGRLKLSYKINLLREGLKRARDEMQVHLNGNGKGGRF